MSTSVPAAVPSLARDAATACPACGARGLEIFHRQPGVPLHSNLLLDDAGPLASSPPRAALRLGLCGACGFIANAAFDPALQEFSDRYVQTQGFSPRFLAFATQLAQGWIDRHGLRGARVLEIGCGDGTFLALMCELGDMRGVGYDPGHVAARPGSHTGGRLRFVPELFTDATPEPADAIVCRHALEHIRDVRGSSGCSAGRSATTTGSCCWRCRRRCTSWATSASGTSTTSTARTSPPARSRRLSARAASSSSICARSTTTSTSSPRRGRCRARCRAPAAPRWRPRRRRPAPRPVAFQQGFAHRVSEWGARSAAVTDAGGRVVLWGSGSKATGFLTALGRDDRIAAVVDINPVRDGTYVAGTGHEIVAPGRLTKIRPDLVIAMNPIYRDEIRGDLAALGLAPEVVAP